MPKRPELSAFFELLTVELCPPKRYIFQNSLIGNSANVDAIT